MEVIKRYNPYHIAKLLSEAQDMSPEQQNAFESLLRMKLSDNKNPLAKTAPFTYYIDILTIAAIAYEGSDTIDSIIYDLKFAVAELNKAIEVLKKEKKNA